MSDIIANLNLSSRWINIIMGTSMLVFGVAGSLLSMYILTRPTFRNVPSIRYLLASSIANFIQLMFMLVPRVLGDGFGIPIVQSNTPYCQIRSILASMATLCSLTYPCWASFDQFVSTSRNALTRHYFTSKRFVYRAIFGTILFWFIVYLPVGIFTRGIGESCVTTNLILTTIYSYSVTPLTYSALPVVAISYFNIGIVRNLRQTTIIGYRQINNRLAKQVRRMLIPQLIILVISGIPFSIQTVYSVATIPIQKDPIRVAVENLVLNIVRLLFYLNYVCSFYIYTIMSSEIRREFKNLFCKKNTVLPQVTVANGQNNIQPTA